ncbi:GerAB/ArcD/ProY family transporter [Brevibacillus sp. B_LB10_24]|uniref:GerAB/ArcD/ProY family transporter n=1 Tax=Brevibacillus sp. B_LB10_24 TaxID=3380645 RepID=UPI0038B833CC
MSRYFHYLVLINMIVNIVVFVPKIMLNHRFNGAVMSIPLGSIIGTTLLIVFTKGMMKFPGKDLSQILQERTPKWVRIPLLLFLILLFFWAGCVTLTAFTSISKRYLMPESSTAFILVLFLAIVGWLARQNTKSVLFFTEITFLINLPFIVFIILKAYANPYLNWDAIKEVGTHVLEFPNWTLLGTSSYVFSGYANLVLFHRVFQEQFRVRFLWLIPIAGFLTLCTTFFVPIGFAGTYAVSDFVYPWFATADYMRMEYGFIERVLYPFLILYISIAFVSCIIHWHVALFLTLSFFRNNAGSQRRVWWVKWRPWLVLAVFAGATYLYDYLFDINQFYKLALRWMDIRLASELFMAVFIVYLARRRKT